MGKIIHDNWIYFFDLAKPHFANAPMAVQKINFSIGAYYIRILGVYYVFLPKLRTFFETEYVMRIGKTVSKNLVSVITNLRTRNM